MKRILGFLAGFALLCSANLAFAELPLTPAQTASLKRDTQKAQDRYVREVAKISGAKEAVVRQVMPDRARITDPASRMISALEKQLVHALSEEQKTAIRSAESDYSAQVLEASQNVRKR